MRHVSMRRFLSAVAVFLLLVASVAAQGRVAAAPNDCAAWLRPYRDWVRTYDPTAVRRLKFSLVTNQRDRSITSHTEGSLVHGGGLFGGEFRDGLLLGEGRAYFSDRRHQYGNYWEGGPSHPFNPEPAHTDYEQVFVDPETGAIEVFLTRWGGTVYRVDSPTCSNGVLYGWGPSRGGGADAALYVLSLQMREERR
jgi:hypothetical protein